jgi:hypothetical protein
LSSWTTLVPWTYRPEARFPRILGNRGLERSGAFLERFPGTCSRRPKPLPRHLSGKLSGSSLQTAFQTASWEAVWKQSGLLPRLVPWNQSGHHPRPRPDASLWWHHFRVMQVLVGLTHVGVMRSATWLLPNAPLLLDTLVAHQVCSVEALVRSCHAKASHFQFDRKFITLTLQHVPTQL